VREFIEKHDIKSTLFKAAFNQADEEIAPMPSSISLLSNKDFSFMSSGNSPDSGNKQESFISPDKLMMTGDCSGKPQPFGLDDGTMSASTATNRTSSVVNLPSGMGSVLPPKGGRDPVSGLSYEIIRAIQLKEAFENDARKRNSDILEKEDYSREIELYSKLASMLESYFAFKSCNTKLI
jgi:hypothetical protein